MPKYRCITHIVEYYRGTEIEAKDAEEATEKYLEQIDLGMIPVVSSDQGVVEAEEIG